MCTSTPVMPTNSFICHPTSTLHLPPLLHRSNATTWRPPWPGCGSTRQPWRAPAGSRLPLSLPSTAWPSSRCSRSRVRRSDVKRDRVCYCNFECAIHVHPRQSLLTLLMEQGALPCWIALHRAALLGTPVCPAHAASHWIAGRSRMWHLLLRCPPFLLCRPADGHGVRAAALCALPRHTGATAAAIQQLMAALRSFPAPLRPS